MKKLILLLGLSGLALTACRERNEEPAGSTAVMKVSVVQPRSVEFARALRLSGSWVAKEDVAITTALQGQQILSVNVDVGAQVKKGQVLAVLEHSNVQSQLQQNSASLARAKANLNAQTAGLQEAEMTLERYRVLVRSEAVSRQEFDQQKAKADTARAGVQAAKAEIAQIQAQLDDSRHQRGKAEVVAPADGVITQRAAEKGALTDANALFHLAKNGAVELEAQANADEMALLQTGLAAKLKTSEPSENANGRIRLVFPEIDPKTRLGKVRISFNNQVSMPIGTYGEAQIDLPKQTAAFAVPFSAVSFGSDGKNHVMVVNGKGQIERRRVALGSQSQTWVEVRSGLQAADNVVRQASAFVSEGDKVQPVPAKE